MERTQRRCLAAVFGVGLVLPFRAGAADDCTRQCRREAVQCVATRCAGFSGDQRRGCRETCRGLTGCARMRTLAYVVAECRTTPQGMTGSQRLMIRRGNCPPTTVMEFPFDLPIPDIDLCRLWGESRIGIASVLAGGFQRLVVSPDGRAAVFEITDDVALIPPTPLPPALEGIYWVKADGTGLRRLAPASRHPRWVAVPNPESPLLGLSPTIHIQARISPDGRFLAYTDLGPGPDGEEAPQVFVLDVATGARKQLTSLAKPVATSALGGPGLACCTFMTNTSISFWYTPSSAPSRQFVINSDGSGVREVPSGTAIPGAELVETFRVVGTRRVAPTDLLTADGSRELAVVFANGRLLQLTNFHRPDLFWQEVSPNGHRIFFVMSADPFGSNPSENCQIFSIGVWGTGLKQLTRFREAEHAIGGCGLWLRRGGGCKMYLVFLDPKTAELVFYSTCDPFGANLAGAQLFAMRSDGSHLRQLTSTRGLVVHDDGSVTTELPGPYWYTSRW